MDIAVNVIEEMGSAMTQGLDNILSIAMGYSKVLSKTSQLICGIAALLYIGSRLWKSWAKGEPIDFYSMLRPFATGLLIVFFSGFVYCLDSLVKPVTAATVYIKDTANESVEHSRLEYENARLDMQNRKAQYERNKSNNKEKLSVWRSIERSLVELKDAVFGMVESVSSFIFSILLELSLAVTNIFTVAVVYFYKIYVVTAKIILVLVGPFTLALSIFPGFSSNLKAWIAQYINISLYVPICNIIAFVQSMIVSECLYKPGVSAYQGMSFSSMSEAMLSQMENSVTMNTISSILLGIVIIMLYAHVPTFANWILRGDGSGGLAAAFSVGGAMAITSAAKGGNSNSSDDSQGTASSMNIPQINNTQQMVPSQQQIYNQ